MTLAYDRTGDGSPLVLLHALGADRHMWDPLVPALSDHHEVITLDLPGFGQSPPLSGVSPTPAALAAAVTDALQSIGVVASHVVGNSLGGWVALEIALAGRATAVTAIAPAGLWAAPLRAKPAVAHRLAAAFSPVIKPLTRTARGRRRLLSGSVLYPERIPPAQAAHLIDAYARAPGFAAVNDAMRAGRFTALAEIPCPVTLVWPDHDRLVNRPATIPDGIASVVLPDTGHIPVWDAPGPLTKLLLQAASGDADAPISRPAPV